MLVSCQEKANESQLFDIWWAGFPIKFDVNFIYSRFINYNQSRNDIFDRLNEEERNKLLVSCQEKANESQLFDIWWAGFPIKLDVNFISSRFINYNYNPSRKEIFDRLNGEERGELLALCQEKANESQLFDIWRQGFPVKFNAGIIYYGFINYSWERKSIFNRLNEEEQSELLALCQEKATNEQLFSIWQDRIDVDIKKLLIEKNNKEIIGELELAEEHRKAKIIASFAQEPYYNILLWTCGLIDEFNFESYAFNYFRLNSNNKRLFTKKAKYFMKEEINRKLLRTLDSWQKMGEEADGTEVYEATWRAVWFGNKHLQICMDSNEAILSHHYFWEYSEEKFNLLNEYISGRRVDPLTVYYKDNQIKQIKGLPFLEEIIYKAYIEKEIHEGRGNQISRGERVPRMPINMFLRNTCIRYLNLLQIPALEPTQVFEISSSSDKSVKADISILFSIPLPHDEVAVIWESLELEKSKATHIFKYSKDLHQTLFENIQTHIEAVTHIRSKLRSAQSEDIKMQVALAYYGNIDHDNLDFRIWRNNLHRVLPTLSAPPDYETLLS